MDLPVPEENEFYTYAILCNNDSIYIGQTSNLQKRWGLHLRGKAAEWTKKHRPVDLFYFETFNSRKEAVKREKELKHTSGVSFPVFKKKIKFRFCTARTIKFLVIFDVSNA